MDETLKKRITWVDSLKGIAMIFIYLGHLGENVGKTYLYVFSFHVPLFFFISGFFNKDVHELTFLKYLVKQLKNILLPYFVFCALNIVWIMIDNNEGIDQFYKLIFQALNGSRIDIFAPTLWFLPCLFVTKMLFYILNKTIKNIWLILIIVILISILRLYIKPIEFFSIHYALGYLKYYVMGSMSFAYLKKSHSIISFNTVLFVSSFLITTYVYFEGTQVFLSNFTNNFSFETVVTIITLFQIFFWVSFSKFLDNFNFLQRIGKNTLYLCGTESLNKAIIYNLLSLMNLNFQIVSPFAGYVFCTVLFILSLKFTAPFAKLLTDNFNKFVFQKKTFFTKKN